MNWLRVLRSGVRPSHADDFAELKARLRPLCKRTLRRQVREHVKYPNRHALVQEFVPSRDEQRLYDLGRSTCSARTCTRCRRASASS